MYIVTSYLPTARGEAVAAHGDGPDPPWGGYLVSAWSQVSPANLA